jgi:HlyD family secretion protein
MKKLFKYLLLPLIVLSGGSGNDDENRMEASGNIEATYVTVSSKSSGEILSMLKDEGDQVSKGDTVFILDHEVAEIQLRQAEAGIKFSEAQFNLLKNGSRKEDIQYAEEMMNQAETNFKSAEKDRNRYENLLKANTIPYKQYEDAAARYDVTLAQYNAAKETLSKIKNIARPEELRQAQANLEKSVAAADLLRKTIRDSYVLSPSAGIITKTFFERGETVNPGSALFKVADLNIVDLVIYVSEEELGKIKTGQKADILTDTYKDKIYNGKVVYISPEAEFTPKNIQTKDERTKLVFAVKIQIANPDFELKPGMPADAEVYIK